MKDFERNNSSGTTNTSSKSSAGLVVYAALLDFDGCADSTNGVAELRFILECLKQIKHFCTPGEYVESQGQDDARQTEDPRRRFKPLFRSLVHLNYFIRKGLSSHFDQAIKATSVIKNSDYQTSMEKFFSKLRKEFGKLRDVLRSGEARPLLNFQMDLVKAGVESSTLAYKKLARSLNQNTLNHKALKKLFYRSYGSIKCFHELFEKLTLGLIVCHLFSQGYDPEQHPLIFISASARINNELDNLGDQQNHNGTVLELMQTLPILVKNFLRKQCNVSQDDQKTIEFWRNMPLDENDSDDVLIHSGKGGLYDQSKMGIILWATHLLSRHYNLAATAHVSIKASFFDDLLIQQPAKGHKVDKKVQFAMRYLAIKPCLLPEGVELSLLGFMPLLAFGKKPMLQPFGDRPIKGTGPTVSRHSINSIVNMDFDTLPEHRSIEVKCWLCCCAYASPSAISFWLQNLEIYKKNVPINRFHLKSNSAPAAVDMDRSIRSDTDLALPLFSQIEKREKLFHKFKKNIVYHYQCRETYFACTRTPGCFLSNASM